VKARSAFPFGRVAFGLAVVAAVVFGVQGLGLPLDRDEGAFATLAREILAGKLPYRDAFDHKGPGAYYVLAGVFWLARGLPVVAQVVCARLVVLLVNLLSGFVLYRLGSRWYGARAGAIAAVIWLAFVPVFDGSRFFTETFAVLPTLLAVWLVSKSWANARASFGSGLALAAASLFKQTSVLALPALWFLEGDALATLAGFGLPWLAVWGGFALAGGAHAFADQVGLANLHYPPQPRGEWWPHITKPLLTCALLFVFDIAGLRYVFARAGRGEPDAAMRRASRALIALQVFNLLPFVTHAYAHYWVQVLPWIALPAALAAERLFAAATPTFARAAVTLALAATFAIAFVRPLADRDWNLSDQVAAAAQIRAAVRTGERAIVAPAEPEYYFLANLQPVTPYLYLLDVDRERYWADFDRELAAGGFSLVAWFGACPSAEYPRSCSLLAAHFSPAGSDPRTGLQLYRLRR
jgi:Dolichyl-phosphate-mannose-protein mannosyltransferase